MPRRVARPKRLRDVPRFLGQLLGGFFGRLFYIIGLVWESGPIYLFLMSFVALFDGFIARNNIDLTDLSSFKIEDVEEFEERMERYPFDEYDDAFYDFEPLQVYLEKFARAKTDELY